MFTEWLDDTAIKGPFRATTPPPKKKPQNPNLKQKKKYSPNKVKC